jgi:hypothetical protein
MSFAVSATLSPRRRVPVSPQFRSSEAPPSALLRVLRVFRGSIFFSFCPQGNKPAFLRVLRVHRGSTFFQPPASLKSAKTAKEYFLAEGQPNLLFPRCPLCLRGEFFFAPSASFAFSFLILSIM